jgi:LysR family transcriptional regulator (chromosome initiation inhibitor)
MNVSTDHVRALAAVVDNGTFELAARALHVTPSAVSQRIKALEKQVGRVLLQRTKPVRPTEPGMVLLRLARQIELLEVEAFDLLGASDESDAGSVRSIPLVINADSLGTWALDAIAEWAIPKQGPARKILLDIHIEDQDYSARLLRDGTVVAAISSEPEAVQGCTVRPLGAMRYRALASASYLERWMPEGPTKRSLRTSPMIVFNRKDALQERYLAQVAPNANPPRHYVPANAEFLLAIRLGLGWGMIADQQSMSAPETRELVDLSPGIVVDVPLYWQQWALDSTVLNELGALVDEAASRHLLR